jgi:integrase
MMRIAKSWGYCTQPVTTSELALPTEKIRKQTRFFNGEEARKIIMLAVEPYRTMFAIAAMTGLRVGAVVGLQKADLDFERRVIEVRRSAWYGRVQTVKSRVSRAPVAMAEAPERRYLAGQTISPKAKCVLCCDFEPRLHRSPRTTQSWR